MGVEVQTVASSKYRALFGSSFNSFILSWRLNAGRNETGNPDVHRARWTHHSKLRCQCTTFTMGRFRFRFSISIIPSPAAFTCGSYDEASCNSRNIRENTVQGTWPRPRVGSIHLAWSPGCCCTGSGYVNLLGRVRRQKAARSFGNACCDPRFQSLVGGHGGYGSLLRSLALVGSWSLLCLHLLDLMR